MPLRPERRLSAFRSRSRRAILSIDASTAFAYRLTPLSAKGQEINYVHNDR